MISVVDIGDDVMPVWNLMKSISHIWPFAICHNLTSVPRWTDAREMHWPGVFIILIRSSQHDTSSKHKLSTTWGISGNIYIELGYISQCRGWNWPPFTTRVSLAIISWLPAPEDDADSIGQWPCLALSFWGQTEMDWISQDVIRVMIFMGCWMTSCIKLQKI